MAACRHVGEPIPAVICSVAESEMAFMVIDYALSFDAGPSDKDVLSWWRLRVILPKGGMHKARTTLYGCSPSYRSWSTCLRVRSCADKRLAWLKADAPLICTSYGPNCGGLPVTITGQRTDWSPKSRVHEG
jgi:hypothetical protein